MRVCFRQAPSGAPAELDEGRCQRAPLQLSSELPMLAQAPGKIVLSGAYAVLEGAPALVAAVDRYVIADATRDADLVTPEVRAAIGSGRAPWFDASALRARERKLGL